MDSNFRHITDADLTLSFFEAKSATHYADLDGVYEAYIDGEDFCIRVGQSVTDIPLCVATAICTVPLRKAIQDAVAKLCDDGMLTPEVRAAIDIIQAAWPETLEVEGSRDDG